MAETQERLQQEGEEVILGQVTKFLQCLDAVFTENRNVISVLPQVYKRFVELEANMAKGTGTGASDNTGYASKSYVISSSNRFIIEGVQNVRVPYFVIET